jgi:hypothetical protein
MWSRDASLSWGARAQSMLGDALVRLDVSRLRVGGHIGGYFSVPPRAVRTLLGFVGSPVWDLVLRDSF